MSSPSKSLRAFASSRETQREEAKPVLVPKLRFPEFRGAEGWKSKRLGELFSERQESGMSGLPLLSLMDKEGIVPQADSNRKNNSNSDKSKYLRVVPGDIAYNTMRMWEGRSALVGLEGLVSPAYTVCEPQPGTHSLLFSYYFKTPQLIEQFRRFSQGLVKDTLNLKYPAFSQISAPVPTYLEQQKIAECLSSVDEVIAAQARKLDALKTHKKGLMQQLFPREGETQPRLRFPEFQNAGEWVECTVDEVIVTVTPPKKLQTSDYQTQGEFPIVDQSQDYICGWTNDGEAVIDKGLPVIVFGDHTCALKFIEHPFVQGADGIKILRPKRGIDVHFLFCALQADPVVQESYKRHFSMLKEKKLFYPDPKSGEQQRIAGCLSSLDDLIAAQTQTLEALKTHKRGLMQQLFPSPEEQSQ